jgi:hypothetical protein
MLDNGAGWANADASAAVIAVIGYPENAVDRVRNFFHSAVPDNIGSGVYIPGSIVSIAVINGILMANNSAIATGNAILGNSVRHNSFYPLFRLCSSTEVSFMRYTDV